MDADAGVLLWESERGFCERLLSAAEMANVHITAQLVILHKVQKEHILWILDVFLLSFRPLKKAISADEESCVLFSFRLVFSYFCGSMIP